MRHNNDKAIIIIITITVIMRHSNDKAIIITNYNKDEAQ